MLAKDYTHLLFVDTDVSFGAHDVLKLIDQQKEVVVGVYPKKYWSHQKMQAMGSSEDFPEQWRYLATDFSTELPRESYTKSKSGEVVEADYAATGFMLISRSCIEKIIEARPEIKYTNDIDGYTEAEDNFYDIFQCKVNPETKKYESEDYGFCKLWKSLGGEITVLPDISLGHRGFNTFYGNLKFQANYFNL
tara:strand:+ start:93 stop:668 length:576 start_codon:yes stop_codon:yes gene_type:complete